MSDGLSTGPKQATGLRERKKAKTRAAIQRHALRLFREQGYTETTVEQIAEAAEVSPSTFFRYYPTKEAVVLTDDYDEPMTAAFREQPPDITPIRAIRSAMHAVYDALSAEEFQQEQERMQLTFSVPELRSAMLTELTKNLMILTELVAKRVGRDPGEFEVRTLAGATVGVVLAAALGWEENPNTDFRELMDRAFAHLEAGLPL